MKKVANAVRWPGESPFQVLNRNDDLVALYNLILRFKTKRCNLKVCSHGVIVIVIFYRNETGSIEFNVRARSH